MTTRITLWAAIAMAAVAWLLIAQGCGSEDAEDKLDRPDPAEQADRSKLLAELAERDVIRNVSSGDHSATAIVGRAWFELSYEQKRDYASVAMDYALCGNYREQSMFVLRLLDWRTHKEAAVLMTIAGLEPMFDVAAN